MTSKDDKKQSSGSDPDFPAFPALEYYQVPLLFFLALASSVGGTQVPGGVLPKGIP